jgi:hypothetical protein
LSAPFAPERATYVLIFILKSCEFKFKLKQPLEFDAPLPTSATMTSLAAGLEAELEGEGVPPELLTMSAADIRQRNALLQQEISFMVRESDRYRSEMRGLVAKDRKSVV